MAPLHPGYFLSGTRFQLDYPVNLQKLNIIQFGKIYRNNQITCQISQKKIMHIETVRRVGLARHLFELAEGCLRSQNDLHLFAAVNLAQDSIESFLIALADHLSVTFDQNTKFDKYFLLIDEKISPRELPFKSAMLRLNRVRIESKHHGIQPARSECERLLASAREFLNEASVANFGAPFSTISAIDLVEDGECKQILISARDALKNHNHEECVIDCRKALYLEVERQYDISAFKDEEPLGLLAGATRAPYYARSKKYVAENVREPTDYIVLDHSSVDSELLKSGVDPTDFWNLWRLTPDVFRNKEGKWYVKRDFSKLDESSLAEVSEYVFNTTLDVVLTRQTNRRATRWRQSGMFYVDLPKGGLSLLSKADKSSPIATTLPSDLTRVNVDYTVEGLRDDGLYWHVCHVGAKELFYGFLHDDDIRGEE